MQSHTAGSPDEQHQPAWAASALTSSLPQVNEQRSKHRIRPDTVRRAAAGSPRMRARMVVAIAVGSVAVLAATLVSLSVFTSRPAPTALSVDNGAPDGQPREQATDPANPATASKPAGPTVAPPPGGQVAGPPGRSFSTRITFYAALDNDPAGSRAIAYPRRHQQAGGVGTFADPITAAADPQAVAIGTVIYYPPLQKYFVVEDLCASCSGAWIDLYAGNAIDAGVLGCEDSLTPGGNVAVELNPPPGRPVDTTPIYSGGRCIGG
jgi:3D (Asp-Asp-Asp) domain-containing protein